MCWTKGMKDNPNCRLSVGVAGWCEWRNLVDTRVDSLLLSLSVFCFFFEAISQKIVAYSAAIEMCGVMLHCLGFFFVSFKCCWIRRRHYCRIFTVVPWVLGFNPLVWGISYPRKCLLGLEWTCVWTLPQDLTMR